MKRITKYALLVVKDNKILLNKEKKHEQLLMPGGKPEKGEDSVVCIKREIKEELGVGVDVKTLQYLGRFEDVAVDSEAILTMYVYRGELIGTPKPQSGVERIVWFGKKSNVKKLSPIIRNKIWPYLVAMRIIE